MLKIRVPPEKPSPIRLCITLKQGYSMVGDKSPGASNKLVDLAVYYSNQDDMSEPSEQIH